MNLLPETVTVMAMKVQRESVLLAERMVRMVSLDPKVLDQQEWNHH